MTAVVLRGLLCRFRVPVLVLLLTGCDQGPPAQSLNEPAAEPAPPASPAAASGSAGSAGPGKAKVKAEGVGSAPVDLSDVPYMPPIPSKRAVGGTSRFRGVTIIRSSKGGPDRWKAQVSQPGGRARLQERLAAIKGVIGS